MSDANIEPLQPLPSNTADWPEAFIRDFVAGAEQRYWGAGISYLRGGGGVASWMAHDIVSRDAMQSLKQKWTNETVPLPSTLTSKGYVTPIGNDQYLLTPEAWKLNRLK